MNAGRAQMIRGVGNKLNRGLEQAEGEEEEGKMLKAHLQRRVHLVLCFACAPCCSETAAFDSPNHTALTESLHRLLHRPLDGTE